MKAQDNWRCKLILASGSPCRLALLNQAGIEPSAVIPAEVDETPGRLERPRSLATRLAREKVDSARKVAECDESTAGAFVIAADTVVAVGRRILPKTELVDEAAACLRLLSGRAHRVYTGVALVTPKGTLRQRVVESRVRFKRLSDAEVAAYMASQEWHGKAGGYAIQGLAGAFVEQLIGSYPSVVGLPLYETAALLSGEGFPLSALWSLKA